MAVDLAGHGGGLGVAVGRPDLGDEELEGVGPGGQRDQLGAHVPAHLAAVDLEAVQPPVAPLAHPQVGQRPRGVLRAADPHPVVPAPAAGVDQGVQRHRRALPAPVHVLAAPGQGLDGEGRLLGHPLRGGQSDPAAGLFQGHGIELAHPLQGARVQALRVALRLQAPGRPLAAHEEVIAGHLVMVGDAGAGALHLHPRAHRGRPRHLPLHQDRLAAAALEGVPDVLRARQGGVDPPEGAVQAFAHVADVEVHDPVGPRPRARGQGRPARRRQRREDADHGPPDARLHQGPHVGHVAGFGHVSHQLHAGAVHAGDDGAPGG